MLMYNINDQLKNGCCGVFVVVQSETDEDRLLVNFSGVGVVKLDRQTWYKYDKDGNILGSRTQYPLSLCYAITVHKCQSLTIDKIVIVHCSQEFSPGQTYVALSRVRREATLQVIGFRKRFLLPPPASLSGITSCQAEVLMPSFECCKAIQLDEAQCETDEISDTCFENEGALNDAFFEDRPEGHFESANSNDGDEVTLEDILLCVIEHVNNKLSSPPFSVKEFLESLIKDSDRPDAMSKSITCAALFALDNLETSRFLSYIIWCRISEIFQNHLAENLEETRMTNAKFTFTTAKIYELFFTNPYRCDLMKAFNVQTWQEITDGQRTLGMKLVFHLHHLFTNEVGKLVLKQGEAEPVPFQVAMMGPEGRGKIRYIGGWAVRKSLEKSRNYATSHKSSSSSDLLIKVRKEVTKAQLLEDNVIVPFSVLQSSTTCPETLNVVESRQFRERGLLHITDTAQEFFISLEQKRVEKINTRRLKFLKAGVIQASIDEVSSDKNLESQFINCFELKQEKQQTSLVRELYVEIVTRYMKMGAGQFLRDYRRDYRVQKSLAHRKAVLQRKEKANERKMKVVIKHIEQDKSAGKRCSHVRLLALVNEIGCTGLMRLYKKKELCILCNAYDIDHASSWNKGRLSKSLAEKIAHCESMPHHQVTSLYTVTVQPAENSATKIPVLRLHRI